MGRTAWAEAEFADFLDAIVNRADRDDGGGCRDCTSSTDAVWRWCGGWPSGAKTRPGVRTGRCVRSCATTCWWPSPSGSRRAAATWRPSATSTGRGSCRRARRSSACSSAARAVPADSLPELSPRPDDSPGASTVANLLSAALAQLCAQQQGRRLARGQRVGPETPDPLVPGRPARSGSSRAPLGLAGRALRRALARGPRGPRDVSRRRPRQRVARRSRAGPGSTMHAQSSERNLRPMATNP